MTTNRAPKAHPVLRVTAQLQTPVAIPVHGSLHLDGLLMAVHPDAHKIDNPSKAMPLSELMALPLPLVRFNHAGIGDVALCSAMQVSEDARVEVEPWTKRRDGYDALVAAKPYTTHVGPSKDRFQKATLVVAREVWWWAVGDRKGVARLVRRVKHVGRLRKMGHGRVRSWTVERAEGVDPLEVLVASEDGTANRTLPPEWLSYWSSLQSRLAVAPPYWHPDRLGEAVPEGAWVELKPEVKEKIRRVLARLRSA